MVLQDNEEILDFVDLKVYQDTQEKLGLQDHQELRDQWVIEVQMVLLEELVLLVIQGQRVFQDGMGYLEMLVPLVLLDLLGVSVTI